LNHFLTLGISEKIADTLKIHGVTEPTPIQEKAIPLLLDGKDIIAQSQTGTGKTFAFVLPILEKIDTNNPNIQALIVTPTRELALQITNEIQKLIEHLEGINILAVYGGQDVEAQLKKLKKNIHIVIGTPGRLLDHIRRETLDLSKTSFLVLDEADQMLHIGFLNEVEEIIKQTPRTRQTLLFSATMPDEIRKLAQRHMFKPENIQVEKTQAPLANIKQIAISTFDRAKQNDLIESLRIHQPFLGVIFCRTKRRVSKLNDFLKANHFNCDELHGDLSQAKREQVMKKFREAKIQYLIATDVAARGLDVDGVTHVFNYDMPLDTESYIHRIGRTGRAGSEGLAVTFYTSKDRPLLEMIESELKIKIDKKNMGNVKKSSPEDKEQERGSNRNRREDDFKGKNTKSRPAARGRRDRVDAGKPERDHRGEKINRGRGQRLERSSASDRDRSEMPRGRKNRMEQGSSRRREESARYGDRLTENLSERRKKNTDGFKDTPHGRKNRREERPNSKQIQGRTGTGRQSIGQQGERSSKGLNARSGARNRRSKS
jgi:ATP-dependent RNA helicase DeaD